MVLSNDGISPTLYSLEYIHIQDVIRKIVSLGQNASMANIDIKSAYRICPVHADDHVLRGMSFQSKIYIDTALPFGMRSAPKIFNALLIPHVALESRVEHQQVH